MFNMDINTTKMVFDSISKKRNIDDVDIDSDTDADMDTNNMMVDDDVCINNNKKNKRIIKKVKFSLPNKRDKIVEMILNTMTTIKGNVINVDVNSYKQRLEKLSVNMVWIMEEIHFTPDMIIMDDIMVQKSLDAIDTHLENDGQRMIAIIIVIILLVQMTFSHSSIRSDVSLIISDQYVVRDDVKYILTCLNKYLEKATTIISQFDDKQTDRYVTEINTYFTQICC
jgi:hypothetical protein